MRSQRAAGRFDEMEEIVIDLGGFDRAQTEAHSRRRIEYRRAQRSQPDPWLQVVPVMPDVDARQDEFPVHLGLQDRLGHDLVDRA